MRQAIFSYIKKFCFAFLTLCIFCAFHYCQYSWADIGEDYSNEVRTRLREVGSILEGVDEQNEGLGFQALQTTFGILGTTNDMVDWMVGKSVEIYLGSLFRSVRITIKATGEYIQFEKAFRRAAAELILDEVVKQLPDFVEDSIIHEKLDQVTLYLYKSFTEADSKIYENQMALTKALDEFLKTAYVKAKTGSSDVLKLHSILSNAEELRKMYHFTSWVTKGIAGQMAGTNASFWVGLKRWSPLVISRTGMTLGSAASTAIGGVLFVADISGAGGTAVHYHKAEPLLKETFSTLSFLWQVYGEGGQKSITESDIRRLIYALKKYRDAVEEFETAFRSDRWYQFVKKAFLFVSFQAKEYREAADEFTKLKTELDERIAYWEGIGLASQSPAPPTSQPVFYTQFVLDSSGSMKGKKLGIAKESIIFFCQAIETENSAGFIQNKAGLITFADDVNEIAKSDSDPAIVLSNLSRLRAGGETNMGAGLKKAIRALDKTPDEKAMKVIVLLSDGKITQGMREKEIKTILLSKAVASGIRLYTIGVGESSNLNESLLQKLATFTGGKYLHARDSSELLSLFREVRHISSGTILSSVSGRIGQGEYQLLQPIDITSPVPALRMDLVWPGSELELIIKNPSGKRVNTHDSGVTMHKLINALHTIITNPQEGCWDVSVFGKDVPGGAEPFSFIASAAQPIVQAGTDSVEDIIQALAENLNRQNITDVMRLYSPDYKDDAGNTHETLSAYYVANIDRFEGVNLQVLDKSDIGGIVTIDVRYAFPMDPAFVARMRFEKRGMSLRICGSEFVRMED